MGPRPGFDELVAIMDRLREPGGCPWDREQSYETLRGYLLEECYEVVDALDRQDRAALREELGDLLFQIVFLSRLGKEENAFDAADVIEGIASKMIRRHPHVFGEDTAETSAAVLQRWEEIKREEKQQNGGGHGGSVLDGVPGALPALVKAHRLGTKAARVGFDWPDNAGVVAKLDEEMFELKTAIDSADPAAIREEVGDILFTVAMLARRLSIDAEAALAGANEKFRFRFARVEAALAKDGVAIQDAGLKLLDRLWDEAKAGPRDR